MLGLSLKITTRKILMSAVGVALAGAASLAPVSPAAAASCVGTACEGRDPHTYGCDSGASNLAEFSVNNHRTILRYSKKCDAWWALATPSSTGPDDQVEIRSYAKVGVPPRYEYRKKYTTTVAGATNRWTRMVPGRYSARACEYDKVPEYSGGEANLYCTPYFS